MAPDGRINALQSVSSQPFLGINQKGVRVIYHKGNAYGSLVLPWNASDYDWSSVALCDSANKAKISQTSCRFHHANSQQDPARTLG